MTLGMWGVDAVKRASEQYDPRYGQQPASPEVERCALLKTPSSDYEEVDVMRLMSMYSNTENLQGRASQHNIRHGSDARVLIQGIVELVARGRSQ